MNDRTVILPDDVRVVRVSEIVALTEQGLSTHEIARRIGVSQPTVYRAMRAAGYRNQWVKGNDK